MPYQKLKKAGAFVHCPHCDSKNIWQTDYENEDGSEDEDGRRCDDCGWEGDDQELVSSAAKAEAERIAKQAATEAATREREQMRLERDQRLGDLADVLEAVANNRYIVKAQDGYVELWRNGFKYRIEEVEN